MSTFTILPRDKACPSTETDQAWEVFIIVDRLDRGVCDVEKDGVYSFSLRQTGDGAWVIFQRDEVGGAISASDERNNASGNAG